MFFPQNETIKCNNWRICWNSYKFIRFILFIELLIMKLKKIMERSTECCFSKEIL